MKHKIVIGKNGKGTEIEPRDLNIKGVLHKLEEKNTDVIELEPYEISGFKVSYENGAGALSGNDSGSKKMNQLKLKITGKIIPETNLDKEVSGLFEKDGVGEIIPIENGELNINSFKLSDMKQEIESKKAKFHLGALNKKTKIFTSKDSRTTDINLNKIQRWVYSRSKVQDYRDVSVNILTSEGEISELYEDMYVDDFKACFVLDRGEGEFELTLAQRFRDEKKTSVLNYL